MFIAPLAGTYRLAPLAIVSSILALTNLAEGQACAAGSAKQILGNWYCSEVKAITYSNFPGHGNYKKVTNMNAETGECTSEKHYYSGSLSPLNEELALHIRGPIRFKRIAVYTPDTSSKLKQKRHAQRAHGHPGHEYLHARRGRIPHAQDVESVKRALGDVVELTMDGKLISWTNEYAGPAEATDAPSAADPLGLQAKVVAKPTTSHESPPSALTKIPPTESPKATKTDGAGKKGEKWARQAYYDAAQGAADGLTFLNHFGGSKGIPGTAAGGPAFGASLSYASSDGQSGAGSSKVLDDAMIEDNVEIILLSDESCDDGGCGYTRPGGVAYHGFGGSQKIFLLDFSMPITGKKSFNGDMPAIWLTNAQIPLTSQYGTNSDCSCWTSGCGEFDLFEVLDPGNERCKSTLHMAPAGGSSDWFLRPTNETMTAAVIFNGNDEAAVIRVLDSSQDFDEILEHGTVEGWTKRRGSVFKMSV